jgi:hypothetical protein
VVQMFAPGAPALPWDTEKQYTRPRLRLYYCSNVGTVLKEEQLVEALQGLYPTNYVEVGAQVPSNLVVSLYLTSFWLRLGCARGSALLVGNDVSTHSPSVTIVASFIVFDGV